MMGLPRVDNGDVVRSDSLAIEEPAVVEPLTQGRPARGMEQLMAMAEVLKAEIAATQAERAQIAARVRTLRDAA
jgi:hypothetical protein